MSEPTASQFMSRRRLLWLAALAAAIATPASLVPMSDANAQTDQAPAADATSPKKKTKSKTDKTKSKTKKTTPADTTPASNPPAAPKQQ
jgi:hypothetical protein